MTLIILATAIRFGSTVLRDRKPFFRVVAWKTQTSAKPYYIHRARVFTSSATLDHVGLAVSNFAKSKSFFERALAPVGYKCLMEYPGAFGFGADQSDFWIGQGAKLGSAHVAFAAPDRATVDSFYNAAIAAGGRDNGKPGIRKEYHPTYYGAFVLDPDGNNIEAVCHKP